VDQGTGRTRDDLTPRTKAKLDPVDPAAKTAVGAAEGDRPRVLICCPLAIEFECVKDELTKLAREHEPLKQELIARAPTLAAFVRARSQLYVLKELDLPNVICRIFTRSYLVIQTGLGRITAESAIPHIRGVDEVWLIGFAGALDPALAVGDVVEPSKVVSERTNETQLQPVGLATNTAPLVTAVEVVSTPTRKAVLKDIFKCAAVDMEANDLALTCDLHCIPFHTARSISDAADETFPKELNGIIKPNGDLSMSRLAWAVIKKPTLVGPLFRLWKNSRKAKEGLRLITRRLIEKLA
jgi:hypothetical protein